MQTFHRPHLSFMSLPMWRRESSFLDNRGPESAEELGCWDDFVTNVLMEAGFFPQLSKNLGRGILVNSDFSGFDAPRESLRVMAAVLGANEKWPASSMPRVRFVRACDSGQSQQRCLQLQSEMLDEGATCVFQDVRGKFDQDTLDWLEQASPTKAMTASQARAANKTVADFLHSSGAIFSRECTSYLLQRRKCPAFVLPGLQNPEVFAQEGLASVSGARRGAPAAWWEERLTQQPSGQSEDDPLPRPISCNISGLICTDYTFLGKRKGHIGAGLTQPCHEVWCSERKYLACNNLEDWFFTENSSHYPVQTHQVEALAESHGVQHVTFCPSDMGFPMRRRRMFSFGYTHEHWAWVGPQSQAEVQSAFASMFCRDVQLTGDVYAQADPELLQKFVVARVKQRRTHLPAGWENMAMEDYLTALLPLGAMVRKSAYEKLRQEREGLAGNFLADLDHNATCGPASGPLMPALDTHANIYSWQCQRLFLGQELLQAQGVDMFPSLAGARGLSPLASVFNRFEDSALRFFAGNGIHVPAYAAWLMFCMGNVRPREELSLLPRQMPDADDAAPAEAEDEAGNAGKAGSDSEAGQPEDRSEAQEVHLNPCKRLKLQ